MIVLNVIGMVICFIGMILGAIILGLFILEIITKKEIDLLKWLFISFIIMVGIVFVLDFIIRVIK